MNLVKTFAHAADAEQDGVVQTMEMIDILASIDTAIELLAEVPETPEWMLIHRMGERLQGLIAFRVKHWNATLTQHQGRMAIYRCDCADDDYFKCERFTTNFDRGPIPPPNTLTRCDACYERREGR